MHKYNYILKYGNKLIIIYIININIKVYNKFLYLELFFLYKKILFTRYTI